MKVPRPSRKFLSAAALGLLLARAPAWAKDEPADGPAADRFTPAFIQAKKGLTLHKDIYVLPLSWSEAYHGNETELLFQVSAKVQLFDMDLYFGFTQKSFWQAYNHSVSSPFRETNYNPEIFYRLTPARAAFHGWGLDAGIEHESNGQSVPESRSWNRIYVAPYRPWADHLLYLKLWLRIPEEEKDSPLDADGDDNPDIVDYLGHGELHWWGRLRERRLLLMLRANPQTGRGALSLDYSYPGDSRDLYYRVGLFNGYGESLIDYDRSLTRISFGIGLLR